MNPSTEPAVERPRTTQLSRNLPIRELIRKPWIFELLLATGTFLLYCGTLAFRFVYDDRMQILENASITKWSYVPQYFTGNVWSLIDPHILANYYRPLFLLWLRINHAIFGLNPAGWHALSVALHVIVVIQVFWLGRRLLKSDLAAGAAAALFAVHPVHIESVTWISGATDPMLAAFMLASVLAFLRYIEEHESGSSGKMAYAASLFFFSMALLSKEVAVMLPLMLVPTALCVKKKETTAREIGMATIPFFLLIVAYLLVRQHALSGFSHPLTGFSTEWMLLTWPSIVAFYARQLLAPFWISPYADVHWVTGATKDFWVPLAICVALIAFGFLAWKRSGERRLLTALYAWIVLPLLPVLYIKVFSSAELVHDRYLYVSSVGFCFLVVVGVGAVLERVDTKKRIVVACTAAAILALAVVTFSGEMYWASDLLLFKHAVEIAPENDAASVNLGIMYAEHQRPDLAEPLLKGVFERNPASAAAAYNYGELLASNHQWAQAEKLMLQALSSDPKNDRWWMELASVQLTQGKTLDALSSAQKAVSLHPEARGYHSVLGVILYKTGDRAGAEREFREELRLHPDDKTAMEGLKELQELGR